MQNVQSLIARWPSMVALQRDINVPYPTIASWKTRNSIQRKYWKSLIEAARRRGFVDIDAECLVQIHTDKMHIENVSEGKITQQEEAFQMPMVSAEPGHFSRHRPARQAHYRSLVEINDHIAALREEWDR